MHVPFLGIIFVVVAMVFMLEVKQRVPVSQFQVVSFPAAIRAGDVLVWVIHAGGCLGLGDPRWGLFGSG